jgi:hypothetical protein
MHARREGSRPSTSSPRLQKGQDRLRVMLGCMFGARMLLAVLVNIVKKGRVMKISGKSYTGAKTS